MKKATICNSNTCKKRRQIDLFSDNYLYTDKQTKCNNIGNICILTRTTQGWLKFKVVGMEGEGG